MRTRATLRAGVTDGIVEAVLDELAAVGFGRLTMDGVARRARAGKAALYRRWSSKQEMVLEVVTTISVPMAETAPTEDLADDVARLVHGVADWLADARMSRIIPDLIAEAMRNPELAAALTERLGSARRNYGQVVIDAAITRGEVSPDVDSEYVLDLIAAPVFWRICGRREQVTPAYLDRVVDTVLHALGSPRA
ncbi:TetR-like C-terminal domain-containing protein [Mycolicibacterium sp. OfavD-34-C]|uniref:TetR-like C-terminal domain-containing protein n=1 Tax=Mycolicibacterium sp. OfavD-34-C TaxID=2917746 RepID=UPI001EF4345E|nr:TetR-like C-terminal domain-containing protein [Mycolicibacterium sp. OfavD-34-C]MCG7578845.1 TetR/AcrR family transcriptional regulator C-terminal ligand-binding domain-containing protein [Mycolicibacterium sp. OfavD-34-C]